MNKTAVNANSSKKAVAKKMAMAFLQPVTLLLLQVIAYVIHSNTFCAVTFAYIS